jgi:phosphatidylglycerophosphate synthase
MSSTTTIPDPFTTAVLAYKYVSPNLSLFERLFLNQFWEKFVIVYPRWLAPNIISCCGGMCCLFMYFLSAYLSPSNSGLNPKEYSMLWYGLFGFLLFAYQTLDGTDGKQARRTKSGSALGELMDHGVDAVVTGFVAMVVCDATGFNLDSIVPWLCVFGGQMTFFMSNLTLLHRGRQQFYPIDIMELQWVMIITLFITSIYGPSFWKENFISVPFPSITGEYTELVSTSLFGLDTPPFGFVEYRFIIAFGAVFGTAANFISYSWVASEPYRARLENVPDHVKRRVPGTGFLQLIKQLLLIIIYGSVCFLTRYRISQDKYLLENPSIRFDVLRCLLFASCYAFGDLMDRVLVMRVAHKQIPLIPPAILCMLLFYMGMRWIGFRGVTIPWWRGVAGVAFVAHLSFFIWVSSKLAKILKIRVFWIPYEGSSNSSSNVNGGGDGKKN